VESLTQEIVLEAGAEGVEHHVFGDGRRPGRGLATLAKQQVPHVVAGAVRLAEEQIAGRHFVDDGGRGGRGWRGLGEGPEAAEEVGAAEVGLGLAGTRGKYIEARTRQPLLIPDLLTRHSQIKQIGLGSGRRILGRLPRRSELVVGIFRTLVDQRLGHWVRERVFGSLRDKDGANLNSDFSIARSLSTSHTVDGTQSNYDNCRSLIDEV
jgi:hypothetical protein